MKVFLMVCHEQDDFDRVYGIFSSREKAEEIRQRDDLPPLVHCADIVEFQLDEFCP